MVGPSGAGKSTLGRLLAGIHPPRTGTRHGGHGGDDRAAARRPARACRPGHPGAPRVRRHDPGQPGPGPRRRGVRHSPARRPRRSGRARMGRPAARRDSTPMVGSAGHQLTPAQAQQVALARLVLADPHTLVLDEATSLIDPRAARHLERSLAAVLHGRTVVAIAHRLFTAHDADRVAVVADGKISEIGSHDELIASGGSYAALWRSWHGENSSPDDDDLPVGAALYAMRTGDRGSRETGGSRHR